MKFFFKVILFVAFTATLTACNDATLLNGLTQQQAVQVLSVLQQNNIAAEKKGAEKGGYTITVDPRDSTSALSLLELYQLPGKPEIQISQAFPDDALVSSPEAERTRIVSLEEQRLEQSLKIIDQIVNARVHFSYSLNTDVTSTPGKEHVAVLLTYRGEINESTLIPKIKMLIKNSLDDIRYENISVALFPSPQPQLAAPTGKNKSLTDNWLYLGIGTLIALLLVAAGMYIFGLFSRTSKSQKGPDEAAIDEDGVGNEKV